MYVTEVVTGVVHFHVLMLAVISANESSMNSLLLLSSWDKILHCSPRKENSAKNGTDLNHLPNAGLSNSDSNG
jgi:hypothetical protein